MWGMSTLYTGHRWPPHPTPEEAAAIHAALHSGTWTDGPWTHTVEDHLTALTGALYAVAFNSCTSALHAALHAHGATHTTTVHTPAFGFAGTITGARHITPHLRYTDIDPRTHTTAPFPDPGPDEATDRVLIPVDLHGVPHTHPRDHPNTITDSCQSLGTLDTDHRHVGHTGTHAWSFSASKLVAAPDGGAITTNDPEVARTLRQLRDYGTTPGIWPGRANAPVTHPGGHNWRPTETSMALIAHRLPHVHHTADRARAAATRLHQAIDTNPALARQHTPPGTRPAWHKIRIGPATPTLSRVAALESALRAEGIPSHRWGATPLHRHPAFTPLTPHDTVPVAEAIAATTLCLGTETCPPLTWTDQELDHAATTLATLDIDKEPTP